MRTFDEIQAIAAERKGGVEVVLDGITPPRSADELAAIPDDRWLSAMAQGIFQAGFSWKVVDQKMPEIEEAFHRFDIARVAFMSEDWFDELIADRRIVRSPQKVRAIQHNAGFIQEIAGEAGSFGRKVGDWPVDDHFGLLDWLAKHGARLGGGTGAYLLRRMGRDGFIMSRDVVARLVAEGVVDRSPTSKRDKAAVQAAFNEWSAQSGHGLTTISRVLAQSIDGA